MGGRENLGQVDHPEGHRRGQTLIPVTGFPMSRKYRMVIGKHTKTEPHA